MRKSILALDLGTDTGYAFGSEDSNLEVGTWKLGTAKEIAEWGMTRLRRRCDPRVPRLFQKLKSQFSPDIFIFEDVEFQSSTYQTQLWSSLRGAVWCAFEVSNALIIECVPVGTLKKFATGSGNATKPMMESSLFRLYPEWKSAKLSDDAIDALWLWKWAQIHLSQA